MLAFLLTSNVCNHNEKYLGSFLLEMEVQSTYVNLKAIKYVIYSVAIYRRILWDALSTAATFAS